ncbi:MAG: hypothetical protein DCC43_08225 [Candidatus Brocadia sp.]|nr:hypothetical protein [Candidatus Brocadia sp. AMX3]RIJ99535.1 MAG: hypothetical protein DCC43_08225 [Candidatus Brocadia sp.]
MDRTFIWISRAAMRKVNKVIAAIQIFIFFSLTLCDGGIPFNVSVKSGEYPCKDHACGCKSESDCKARCCCSPRGNASASQSDVKNPKDSFQSFISSLQCKSGSDAVTIMHVDLKFIPDNDGLISSITFLCFLTSDTVVYPGEPMVSPPEKPPRCSA